ncbi:retrovirus-related pol polyprotein from transposon TNT 1-94 [Tanacetum coccineum]
MHTRNSYFPNNSNVTIPRRRNKGRAPNIVEPKLRTIVAPMAERMMEELLRAPTEGYREAILGVKDDMDARSDVYVLSNGFNKCSDDIDVYYWEYTPGDCDVEKNGKWSCIYAVGSQEYQMVCTRLDIASIDVGMLDKFDRGLQTDVQVFVDFDYAMGMLLDAAGAKFDIEKFNGTGDFGLWRIKMRALLIQHGCEAALEVLPADMEAQTKAELYKKAHSAVILCLGNKVLRKNVGILCMPAGRKIFEHIDEFNKIVLDLANIEVKFEDEDLALLLLTSLPASYEHFLDTLLYGQEALTLEDVNGHNISKEIKESDDGVSAQFGDSRSVRSRGIGKGKSKDQLKDGSSFVLHNVRKAHYSGSDRLCSFRLMGSVLGGIIGRFKHEAFGKFKERNQLVENQSRRTVKKLRADNGLEFCNREFEQLCIESGIARHLIVSGTPQQNRVAEHMNKTLMDKVTTESD